MKLFCIIVTLVALIPVHVFGMMDIERLTPERAKDLGVQITSKAAGPALVRIELTFDAKGELKSFIRVDMNINEQGKLKLAATLSISPMHISMPWSIPCLAASSENDLPGTVQTRQAGLPERRVRGASRGEYGSTQLAGAGAWAFAPGKPGGDWPYPDHMGEGMVRWPAACLPPCSLPKKTLVDRFGSYVHGKRGAHHSGSSGTGARSMMQIDSASRMRRGFAFPLVCRRIFACPIGRAAVVYG